MADQDSRGIKLQTAPRGNNGKRAGPRPTRKKRSGFRWKRSRIIPLRVARVNFRMLTSIRTQRSLSGFQRSRGVNGLGREVFVIDRR